MGTDPNPTDPPAKPDPTPAPPATDPPQEGGNVEELPPWARAAITKANGQAAAARLKIGELEPLAAKARELEEAGKTESQRAAELATAAEARAVKAEANAARLEVALEKGLTPSQARRLVGTTKEELAADADELLETFGKPAGGKPPPPGGKPVERLRGGNDPTEEPIEMDPRKLAAAVRRI